MARASQSGGGGLYSWSRSSKSNATTSSPPNQSKPSSTTSVAVSKSASPPKVATPSYAKPPIGSTTQIKGSGSPPSSAKAKLPFVNTSVDNNKRVSTGNALPPGSPLNAGNRPPSPRSQSQQQVPVNAASLFATKDRRKSMMMGPSLGERLASLNEQGVFGDPHLSRFGAKPSTTASSSSSAYRKPGVSNNYSSSITSSPLLSPRQATSNVGFSSKPNGISSNSRPVSSVAGSTFNFQSQTASSCSYSRPQSSTLNAVAAYERKAQSTGSQTGSTGFGSPNTTNNNKQLSVSTGASPLSMPRKPSPTNNNTSSQRFGTSSQRFTGASSGSTQSKVKLSTLNDVEFYRLMGVFRNEFNQYGAKRKEELMQAKNAC